MPKKNDLVLIDLSGFLKGGVSPEILEAGRDSARRAFATMESDAKKGLMDFTKLPSDRGALKDAVSLARRLRPGIDDVIVCGIGGSSLGFLAVAGALLHPFHNDLKKDARGGPRFFVLDNADAETVGGVLDLVNLSRTLIVLISKSGSPGETTSNFFTVFEALVAKFRGNAAKAFQRVVIITDPPDPKKKNPLREFLNRDGQKQYRVASLPIPPNVGGRFSVLTPVGIFPAALMGIDVAALLAGAGAMHARCAAPDISQNPAMTAALLLDAHYRAGRKITVFMPYANALWRTADWFRQLWAESLGKAKTRSGKMVHVGMTPMAALGATDQHSQVQLYAEGPDDKTYVFLRTKSRRKIRIPHPRFAKDAYGFLGGHTLDELLNVEGDATEAALDFFGRPTARITMPGTSAHALGQVFMFWEMTTACVGALWNINAFNQPGVELGKRLTACSLGDAKSCEKVVDAKTGVKVRDILRAKPAKAAPA